VDFKTAGATSMFTLDKDGNVVAGLRFGNAFYDSEDEFTLDYYEEGTWIPSLNTSVTVAGWDSTKYKIFKGNYTRIGDRVKVDFTIKIDGLSSTLTGTAADMYISGFPFRPDFERISGVGADVEDPLNPAYPLVPLKGMGIDDGGGSQVGEISAFAGAANTVPTGWLICNGQSLSRTTYSALFSKIGITYGSDDSLTFKVPDLRGYFVRGLNDSGDTGPGGFRTLGSTQSDMVKGHTHGFSGTGFLGVGHTNRNYGVIGADFSTWQNRSPATVATQLLISPNSTDPETRPANMALNYMIFAGNEKSIADLSGGFVLYNGSNTRLYLYDSISTLDISNIPGGTGIVSTLFGSFEYFISSFKSVPIVSAGSFNVTFGSGVFSIPLSSLISSESTLVSSSIQGLPYWMRYDDYTQSLEFAVGYSAVPAPQSSYSFTLTAVNAQGSGSGTIAVNSYVQQPPIVRGAATTTHTFGASQNIGFTASNGPITGWTITPSSHTGLTFNYSGVGATISLDATYNEGVGAAYTISAVNGSGTGSTVSTITTTVPFNKVLYFNLTTPAQVSGGGGNINIYDASVNGNRDATTGMSFTGSPNGTFQDEGLQDGNTYYAEASGTVNLYYGVLDSVTLSNGVTSESFDVTLVGGNTYSFARSLANSRLAFTFDDGVSDLTLQFIIS
jgi:microcystin-dependent protein